MNLITKYIKKYTEKLINHLEDKAENYFLDRKEKKILDIEIIAEFLVDFSKTNDIIIEKICMTGITDYNEYLVFLENLRKWETKIESHLFQDKNKQDEVETVIKSLNAFMSRFAKETDVLSGKFEGYIGFIDMKYKNPERYYKAIEDLSERQSDYKIKYKYLIKKYNKEIRLYNKLNLITNKATN